MPLIGFARETESALADHVAVHLVGSSADAALELGHELELPETVFRRVGEEHAIRALEINRELDPCGERLHEETQACSLNLPMLQLNTSKRAATG